MARPNAITDERLADVQAVVAVRPGATMQELCDDFAHRTGLKVCTVTLHRALKRAGLELKATRQARATRRPRGTATPTRKVVRRPGAFGEWDHPHMPLFAQAGGFVILPKRWVVERTHAWLEHEQRMVMHHDRSTQNATASALLAQSRMPLRRLAIDV